MFSIHPIEVMWAQAPEEIKVNLALSLIVEILKLSDGGVQILRLMMANMRLNLIS